ncbi:hypothetical protein P691DRAFT_769399 [Macrolepiota fuliginosa MF-IS2]|uniref:Uncharacterized protein n=1 Tax=Macrolepiota fuliginosa MF-IS2 TaxID=1400762 RepID=A0A9P5WXM6_9AGAR|nr:hypothetical protein P691DRAFT_769399 [Macrolepiota fuliginosa MF-IS2]
MPHKPKSKLADNATNALAFKPSNATQHFLTVMNQNHHAASSFTIDKYTNLVPPAWRSVVMDNLLHMHFKVTNLPTTTTPAAPIEVDNNDKDDYDEELTPAEELINTIAAFGQCEAASQTPAPSHEASTPPPPPAAAASIPPAC